MFARVAILLGLLLAVVQAQPTAQRPHFLLQGLQLMSGTPGATLQSLTSLSGFPAGLRSDIEGRCVIRDNSTSRLWLWSGTDLVAVALPSVATDAVPDGRGGAVACGPVAGGGAVWSITSDGGVTLRCMFVETPLRLALVEEQHVVLRVRDAISQHLLVVHELHQGQRRAMRVVPIGATDVHFDDAGRVLLADAATGRVLHLDARTLLTQQFTIVPAGMTECAAYVGGGLVGVLQPGFVLWSTSPWHGALGLSIGWPVRFESLASGGVLVWVQATGEALHFDSVNGLAWQGLLAAAPDASDGSGLRHARSAALHLDSDADGFDCATELAEFTDPGNAASVPLRLEQTGPLLRVSAPQHAGAWWWMQVCGESGPPLWPMESPPWISGVFGSFDPTGEGFALLAAPVPAGATITPVLLDLFTGQVLVAPASVVQAW